MSGRLTRISDIMGRTNCGQHFWRILAKACDKAGGSANISIGGWEKLLEIAREDGLVGLVTDEQGNPTKQVSSIFTFALLEQWRRVQRAKAEGWTSAELARQTEADIVAEHLGVRKASADYDRHQTNVRQDSDRFSRKSVRTREALDDEFAEIL